MWPEDGSFPIPPHTLWLPGGFGIQFPSSHSLLEMEPLLLHRTDLYAFFKEYNYNPTFKWYFFWKLEDKQIILGRGGAKIIRCVYDPPIARVSGADVFFSCLLADLCGSTGLCKDSPDKFQGYFTQFPPIFPNQRTTWKAEGGAGQCVHDPIVLSCLRLCEHWRLCMPQYTA